MLLIPFETNKIIIPGKITKMALYIKMEKNREWQIELNIPAMEKEMATFGPIPAIGGRRRKKKGRNLVGIMEINQNNKFISEMRERAFSDEKNSDSTPIFHLGQNGGHSLEGAKIQNFIH